MTGLSDAIAGGIYAVMLAFVAVGVYESMDKSETIASDEANFAPGWAQLRKISLDLVAFEPATAGQGTVKVEMVDGVNELFSARRARPSRIKQPFGRPRLNGWGGSCFYDAARLAIWRGPRYLPAP